MGRRQSDKFIPDSDRAFAQMARNFHRHIAREPARFHLSAHDAELLDTHVSRFRDALALATRPHTRNQITVLHKDEARVAAERVVRKYGKLIRANDRISTDDKMSVGVRERPARLRRRACPQTRPMLLFVRQDGGAAGGEGVHVLRCIDQIGNGTRAKPDGANRIELFVGLVWPNDPVPTDPRPLSGGPFWYLGSFSKSPLRVRYPLPGEAMRVVYWARWAGDNNDVGPFSRTCDAGVVHCSSVNAMRIEDQRTTQTRLLPVIVHRVDETPLLTDGAAQVRRLPEAA